ncbi:MAG: hypothetical protein WDO72_07965 [Pseudomonadota bacterium]
MKHTLEGNVITLVTALDEASMFVLFAARTHRANQQRSVRRRQCLCHLFHSAGMCGSQILFAELQNTLIADDTWGFQPAERGARVVNRQEMLLLAALSHWQRHPADTSDLPLRGLAPPAARRIAAPLAREFAQRMVYSGLLLDFHSPEARHDAAASTSTTAGAALTH